MIIIWLFLCNTYENEKRLMKNISNKMDETLNIKMLII